MVRRAHEAQLAASPVRAANIGAVDHQTAAQTRGNQDVEEAVVALAVAKLHLAHGGGGGVILDEDRQVERLLEQRRNVDVLPGGIGFRAARQIDPPEIVGHRHAQADDLAHLDIRAPQHVADRLAIKRADLIGQREIHLLGHARQSLAGEIDQHDGDMVAVDVDADRIAGVALHDQLRRRLAAPAATLPGLLDQAVLQQAFGDVGDGGAGQPGDMRKIEAGERPQHADGMQRDALVVIGRALQIGAGQAWLRLRGPARDGMPVSGIVLFVASIRMPHFPSNVPSRCSDPMPRFRISLTHASLHQHGACEQLKW
jgi:hypothetical protein